MRVDGCPALCGRLVCVVTSAVVPAVMHGQTGRRPPLPVRMSIRPAPMHRFLSIRQWRMVAADAGARCIRELRGSFRSSATTIQELLRGVLEQDAREPRVAPCQRGPVPEIGILYASCMDTVTIERLGWRPLQPDSIGSRALSRPPMCHSVDRSRGFGPVAAPLARAPRRTRGMPPRSSRQLTQSGLSLRIALH